MCGEYYKLHMSETEDMVDESETFYPQPQKVRSPEWEFFQFHKK